MKHLHYYNFYFKDGMRDWDKESMIQIQDFLMQSDELTGHGVRIRCDCFGMLLLEVPYSGDDAEMMGVRSRVIQACEDIRAQVATLQLSGGVA